MNTKNFNTITVAAAKTIKGTSFVGIRNYQNSKGEVSNYLLIAGYSHEQAMQNDFNQLKSKQNEVFNKLEKEYSKDLILQAYTNIYESLEKRLSSPEVKEILREQNDKTINKSDAQNNAYKFLAKGVRLHIESNIIHIIGLEVKKTVIKSIEYKPTKSRDLTICQNKIKKLCEFKESKIRTFKFDKEQIDNAEIKIQGITL